ncbi:MAG: stalk domain-containing protein [Syntrophomonadales bacterium]
MLKNKRLISIIATLAFCLSFLAPAIIAPAPAVAATTYTAVMGVPSTTTNGVFMSPLRILETADTVGSLVGSTITVYLPAGVEYTAAPAGLAGYISVPANVGATSNIYGPTDITLVTPDCTTKRIVFTVTGASNPTNDKGMIDVLFGYYNGAVVASTVNMTDGAGDLNVTILGNTASVTKGQATLARILTKSTTALVLDTTTIGEGNNQPGGIIDIRENVAGALAAAASDTSSIELILPSDFTWNAGTTVVGSSGLVVSAATINTTTGGQSRLTFGVTTATTTTPGYITITPRIDVDSQARDGEVVVQLKGSNSGLTGQALTIATKGSFGINVSAATTPEILAGRTDADVAEITIKENMAGSIFGAATGRTLYLELPDNARWQDIPTVNVSKGNIAIGAGNYVNGTNQRKISYPVTAISSGASTIEFEYGSIDVKADTPASDVKVTFSGTAGVTGEVIIAKIVTPITGSGDKPNVGIGLQNQAAGDFTITETKAGALMAKSGVATRNLVLETPSGVTFETKPVVSVTEGDLKLDVDNVSLNSAKNVLTIPMRSSSLSTASVIKVSGVKYVVDRTVPEGEVRIKVRGTALDDYNAGADTVIEVANAVCTTPAPADQGRNASFYIGSTIMNVNGANIIMDAAPYIKAGRTYVPVRYLGDALGATTAWDEATKTVTVTKGDKTVVLVIGSKVAKVNGADVQMDVAPEITGVGRTMLPARWVAEGLGYAVGWNAALQQVVIQ